jgi:Protein of unknown function (DUF3768)
VSAALDSVERRERIARLNDGARQAMGVACIAVATEGFRGLSHLDQARVREAIERYDAWEPGNDPDGERDFGAIYRDERGRWSAMPPGRVAQTVFWKIDCYDQALEWGSPDPADAGVTQRVLTIMLASEY